MERFLFLIMSMCLWACSGSGGGNAEPAGGGTSGLTFKGFEVGNCLVPTDQLADGGPPKDGIPSILNPQLQNLGDINPQFNVVTREDALVLVMEHEGQVRAYPEMILWLHEIVNDSLADLNFAVSYCPLTGSAVCFTRAADELYSVSGILFETNLVMYDRGTESLWPQMDLAAACGERRGEALQLLPVKEMSMGFLKQLYPNISTVVGAERNNLFYGNYPYGTYDVIGDDTLLFPVTAVDDSLPLKSLVLTVHVNGQIKGYPHIRFEGTAITQDQLDGQPYAVFNIDEGRYANAFSRRVGEQTVNLNLVEDSSAPGGYLLADDTTQTRWDLAGRGISGPLAGTKLTQMLNFNVMWFSYRVSFPDAQTFNPTTKKGFLRQ